MIIIAETYKQGKEEAKKRKLVKYNIVTEPEHLFHIWLVEGEWCIAEGVKDLSDELLTAIGKRICKKN